MTTEEAILKLKELQLSGDPESSHYEADNVLCELLVSLGLEHIVKEYVKISKWYA